MNGDELKKMIPKWALKIGVQKAERELIVMGIGVSTATHLVRGTYVSTPKELLSQKLRLAMKDFLAELAAS